ncbi:MAG: hypothetical protein HY321_08525 [Armatimonadetes bacterium]|nr:hypothetical protein [Armatimonadota bacterium]
MGKRAMLALRLLLAGAMAAGSRPVTAAASASAPAANDWPAKAPEWFAACEQVHVVPLDHPRLAGVEEADLLRTGNPLAGLAAAAHGSWVPQGDLVILAPDPDPEGLEPDQERAGPVLEFLRSLTAGQREALAGGGLVRLRRFDTHQVALLAEAFASRDGTRERRAPVPRALTPTFSEAEAQVIAAVSIRMVPALRVFIDGIEEREFLDFMFPLWGANAYNSSFYVILDAETGDLLPWPIDTIRPPGVPKWLPTPPLLQQPPLESPSTTGAERPTPGGTTVTIARGPSPLRAPAAAVTIAEMRAYSLEEICRVVSEAAGSEVRCGVRIRSHRLLLTKGACHAGDLLEACRRCYRLPVQVDGDVTFLGERVNPGALGEVEFGWALHRSALPLLLPLDEGLDYPGLGFPLADYLARRHFRWAELTAAQRDFVEDVWWFCHNEEKATAGRAQGYWLGQRTTAEAYYSYYGASPSRNGAPRLGDSGAVEVVLEPTHTIAVLDYRCSDFLDGTRRMDPDVDALPNLPAVLYGCGRGAPLALRPEVFLP